VLKSSPIRLSRIEKEKTLKKFEERLTRLEEISEKIKSADLPLEEALAAFEEGIKLSMEQYGVDATAIQAYINNNTATPDGHANDPRGSKYNYHRNTTVKIQWNAGGSDQNLERIITQKWIAMYPMGLEAWAEYRRTGFPELAPSLEKYSQGSSAISIFYEIVPSFEAYIPDILVEDFNKNATKKIIEKNINTML